MLFAEAALSDGFVAPELKLAVIPFRRLVHRRRAAAPAPARGRLATLHRPAGGRPRRPRGPRDRPLRRLRDEDRGRASPATTWSSTYRGDDRVFAPTDQLAKITRYVGTGGERAAALGAGVRRAGRASRRAPAARRASWRASCSTSTPSAARAAATRSRPTASGSSTLERSFPYRETADQLEAIEAVKADMESERPMDRLICGDVGYGKTEVALRAAHKAASDGKQVMMLVPTTILAQQHLGTFRERLARLPDRGRDGLAPAQARPRSGRPWRGFADGKVDILIGTHRLLSRDVRAAGPRAADRRRGAALRGAPEGAPAPAEAQGRRALAVGDPDPADAADEPRRAARHLGDRDAARGPPADPHLRRPLRRGARAAARSSARRSAAARPSSCTTGSTRCHEVAERLRALCPGVRFAEAHGQMDESELERTMLEFLRGDADCLVATTIIESGLDIPQANTLIVERADELGLAQAYQIRGRVGRSRERAYAYLLYPVARRRSSPEAAARLATLSDYTELGSGFAIAMRDLELRGAGDLLGDEQSGPRGGGGLRALRLAARRRRRGAARGRRRRRAPRPGCGSTSTSTPTCPPTTSRSRRRRSTSTGGWRARASPASCAPCATSFATASARCRSRSRTCSSCSAPGSSSAASGARTVEFRGGRLSATPLELDAAAVGRLRERIPEAMYESRVKTLSLRVPDEPERPPGRGAGPGGGRRRGARGARRRLTTAGPT